MHAREVDDAASRLRELRADVRQGFALGATSVGGALAATEVAHELVLPLFLGGMFVAGRGMRALLERFELLETLLGQRDAYVIAEVRERALVEAAPDRRRALAGYLRTWLPAGERLGPVAGELAMLAAELEDETLELDPVCAVACKRLLCDPSTSPLLDPTGTAEDVRSRIHRIQLGFAHRLVAETDASEPRADVEASARLRWYRAAPWLRGRRRAHGGGSGVPGQGSPR